MRYRRNVKYDISRQNESRADMAEQALATSTDRSGETAVEDVYLDVSDLIAHLKHFCDRAGLDWEEVYSHGEHGYEGDYGDGPYAARDYKRFPATKEEK
jgi:hypothetical protein